MKSTTLKRILACQPRAGRWAVLLSALGKTEADDELLPYARILEVNGLDVALWATRCEPKYGKEWRLLAVKYARSCEHLITNRRCRDAINVAERHANGHASDNDLQEAWAAATKEIWAAWAAWGASETEWRPGWQAARAAEFAARETASVAACRAPWAAANEAARALAFAASAEFAANEKAKAATRVAVRILQAKQFLEAVEK